MRFVPSIRKLIVNTTILSFAKFSVCSLSMINPPNYAVRKAESRDLPQIHGLIKDSFAAMNEYFPDPAMHDMMAKAAQSMCDGELSESEFEKTYFSSFGHHFWVIEECETLNVFGCVGLKRHTADSAELVRMAVTPNIRGQGLGNLLVKKLDDFCTESGVLRVTLSTANPRAGNFYKKCGFVNLAPEESKVSRMVKYFGERVIRKVTIVGGTHGNERIGIELVRQWAADGSTLKRSSFETSVLLGNPLATDANIRYVTSDMNRQFARKDITSWDSTVTKGIEHHSEKLGDEEILHAKRLHQVLGPKGAVNEAYNCDFIIDLHSSVSNVGLMGMINGADKDCHAVRLSQYLLEERSAEFPGLRITNSKLDKNDSPNVDSISPYGIAFEVGPIAHGTLSSKLLEETRQLVYASLDFIESQNMKLIHAASLSEDVPFIGSATSERGVIHSQGRDIVVATSPSTKDLICKMPPFREIECFIEVAKIHYPDVHADRGIDKDGKVSDKVKDILTYPTTTCIHPSLEGKDWVLIEDGQPAFISTDGLKTEFPFQSPPEQSAHFRPPGPPEEPPKLYPLFINEAAYQLSGVAFPVYKAIKKVVP